METSPRAVGPRRRPRLDPVVHPLPRLRICSVLAQRGVVEMAELRRELDLSKSALSKQVAALVDGGYVCRVRARDDARQVRLALTDPGAAALREHLAAVLQLAGRPPVARPTARPAEDFSRRNSCHLGKHR